MSTPPNPAHGASATKRWRVGPWKGRRSRRSSGRSAGTLGEPVPLYCATGAAGVAMARLAVGLLAAPHSCTAGDRDPKNGSSCWLAVRHTGWLLLVTGFVVGVFLLADALYGERGIAVSFSGNRCQSPILRLCFRRRVFRLVVLPVIVVVITI